MTDAAHLFEHELEILRTEAESAAQFLYSYMAIHEVSARHAEVENLLNTASLFWDTTLGALQISAFIAMGRVFDEDKGSHGVARLLHLAIANPQIFTRGALAARKQGNSPTKPEWLDEYLSTTYEPTAADFEFLQQKVAENKAIYEIKYKPIRNKVFAHKDIKGNAKVHALFAQTNIREWQTLTLFLQSLYDALLRLFNNGIKPELREHPHDVAGMINKPIPPGRRVPAHERIARQVAEFLLTAAKGNPSKISAELPHHNQPPGDYNERPEAVIDLDHTAPATGETTIARTGNLIVQAIEMDGEEVFVAWLVDFAGASILKSSEPLTALELRSLLREAGETDTIIDQRIHVARQASVT